ncbi:hypothetical protein BSKO_00285 [Bryopsis sp. KO-2023]|nr:hypothetical protein BSKO_00285 [Bryopsis sp. KO-2023]
MTSSQQGRSVFRRGGQKESGNDPEKDLDEKLEQLSKEWNSQRIGKDQTVGLWKESLQVVEIVRARGKLLHAMGFFMNQKHYLHIEEAVFLMDRGSLLLFLEGFDCSTRLASLQEAYETMNMAGVSVDRFVIYCQLKRNGFIVRRYPTMWSVAAEEVVASVWKDWSCETCQSMDLKPGKQANQQEDSKHNNHHQTTKNPSLEGVRAENLNETGKDAKWWPGVSEAHPWLADTVEVLPDIPKCEVAAVEEAPLANGPPPFPPISRQGKTSDCPKPRIVFEVFQPNSHFKRKSPDAPYCVVCTASGQFLNLNTIKAMESARAGTPVMYAMVEDGDVMFFSVTETSTRVLP